MLSLFRGFSSGWQLLRTSPAAALAAVAALALGIGASTTMFSIVHGGTRGLPFENPDAIFAVQPLAVRPGAASNQRLSDYRLWSSGLPSIDSLGAFQTYSFNISGDDNAPERAPTALISPSAFEVLRVRPVVGREFTSADAAAGAEKVAIVSHALWTNRYAGEPAAIGRVIRLDGVPHRIVGVMPPRFGFPINAAIWTPLPVDDLSRSDEIVQVFGRLAPGATMAGARAELLAFAQAAAPTGDARAAVALDVISFVELETPAQVRWGLYLLLLAASGVLFIACVNVAALFIARAVARARDVAVRLALGAERRQILVEQVGESCVFSSLAALGGVAMAWSGTRAFRSATAGVLEAFWMDFRVD